MRLRAAGSEPTAKYTTQISPHMTIHQNKIYLKFEFVTLSVHLLSDYLRLTPFQPSFHWKRMSDLDQIADI